MKELLAALGKVKAGLGSVKMTGKNDHDQYEYLKENDIINAVEPLLHANNLLLVKEVLEVIPIEGVRKTKSGGDQYAVRVKMKGTLYHIPTGEHMEITSFGEGQDRADKGLYKAMTGASKYLMSKFFNIATGDDPETDRGTQGGGNQTTQKPPQSNPNSLADARKRSSDLLVAADMDEQNLRAYMMDFTGGATSDLNELDEAQWGWACSNQGIAKLKKFAEENPQAVDAARAAKK